MADTKAPNAKPASEIEVVTTKPGVVKGGVVPVGTKMKVAPQVYSFNWMRPADEKASKQVEALRKERDKAKADAKA